jgi:hypothetical protein
LTNGNHIIEKVVLEVNTGSELQANQIKNNVSLFFQNEVFPVLDELLNSYDTNQQIIRFDRLDVDFKIDSWENRQTLKTEFLQRIKQQIDEAHIQHQNLMTSDLGEQISQEDTLNLENSKQLLEPQQNEQSTFLFFLENGYLPWFGREEYISKITAKTNWRINLKQNVFLTRLKVLLQTNQIALERFVLQFSDDTILVFVEFCKVLELGEKKIVLNFIDKLSLESRKQFTMSLVNISISSEWQKWVVKVLKPIFLEVEKNNLDLKSDNQLKQKVDEIIQQFFTKDTYEKFFQIPKGDFEKMVLENHSIEWDENTKRGPAVGEEASLVESPTIMFQDFVSSKKEKEPPFFESGSSDIFVQNAGLVLFHPFLPVFFKAFKWVNEKGRIRKEHLFHVVQAIHYCATCVDTFFESDLIFEKYLCGLPLNKPIPKRSLLNKEIKEEADNMITQVIRNWPALKNTSIDGLRQMFIQREGKLIQTEKGCRLIVERKAQDILLESLQWNISIVKLPWKDDLLFVEW